MAELQFIRQIGTESGLADGSSFTHTYKADQDYTIKYLRFTEESGKVLDASDFTFTIDNNTMTKDQTRMSNFQATFESALELNIPLKEAQELKIDGTNNEGVAIDFATEIFLYQPTGFNA